MDINQVITLNVARQKRARELNIRAGEALFPVLVRSELESWLTERLAGAISVATIPNLESLILPPLNDVLKAEVLANNPDTVEVLGRKIEVKYRQGYEPRINIDFRGAESRDWTKLPDIGIHLPNGREVSMYSVVEGYGYYIEAKSSQFNDKVRKCLNQGLWEKWQRPQVVIPDLTTAEAMPAIESREYGRCVVTGEPLMAFGTVIAQRYWSSDPINWKFEWYQDWQEAEKSFTNAVAILAEYQTAERKKQLKNKVEAAKSRASSLYYHNDSGQLDQDKKCELYDKYTHMPSELDELEAWTAQVEAMCVEVEAVYAEIQRKRDSRKNILIPPSLLTKKAFGSNDEAAYAFMHKVALLDKSRLDSHIIGSCGRARVQEHLIEVSGDQDFFLGSDPNAVVGYVRQVCFGGSENVFHDADNSPNTDTESSLGSLGDALRKAGLTR